MPWRHVGVGGIAPCIPNLGCRWSCLVIFMLGLGGPQSWYGFGKEINLLPMLRTEPLCLVHQAYSLVTILTELFHLHWVSRAVQNDISFELSALGPGTESLGFTPINVSCELFIYPFPKNKLLFPSSHVSVVLTWIQVMVNFSNGKCFGLVNIDQLCMGVTCMR